MSAIKDLVNLCVTLNEEGADQTVTRAIRRIQTLTIALQSEQAAIMEKNMELLTENLNLKRSLFDLESAQTKFLAKSQETPPADAARQAGLMEENRALLTENLDLKRMLSELEASHAHAIAKMQKAHHAELAVLRASVEKPKDEIDRQTTEILKLFFASANELSSLQVALAFKLNPSMAEYHLDELLKRQFIVQTRPDAIGRPGPGTFRIATEGRSYVVTNRLIPPKPPDVEAAAADPEF